jgi:hypothetical protein
MSSINTETGAAHEVLLVGSVPLRPAEAVFEAVAAKLGRLVSRIPDGDQHGWVLAAANSFAENDALEPHKRVKISRDGVELQLYRLRDGKTSSDLILGPYHYADTAAASYEQFKRLRSVGVIPPAVRFQVTLPGPGTSAYVVGLPAGDLLPIARRALALEIEQIAAAVPADDLTIQLDIAMEAEHEEYRRRPAAFDTPIHEEFDWTLEQMADSAAWLANQVPAGVELGFHICSIWHHYQAGGQDNAVLVDAVNALASRVTRPIEYVHIPTIPEHDEADFAPLAQLELGPETRLFLGVIHASDGLDGALRRIRAAKTVVSDFGIASFCGLGIPQFAVSGDIPKGLRRGSTPETIEQVLEIHRRAATTQLNHGIEA